MAETFSVIPMLSTEEDCLDGAYLSPPLETESGLLITGSGSGAEASLTIQGDLKQLVHDTICNAFSCHVAKGHTRYRVTLRHRSGAIRVWDIEDHSKGPHAIPGEMGQLFLGGDSNGSFYQFTQEQKLSSAASWQKLLTLTNVWKKILI